MTHIHERASDAAYQDTSESALPSSHTDNLPVTFYSRQDFPAAESTKATASWIGGSNTPCREVLDTRDNASEDDAATLAETDLHDDANEHSRQGFTFDFPPTVGLTPRGNSSALLLSSTTSQPQTETTSYPRAPHAIYIPLQERQVSNEASDWAQSVDTLCPPRPADVQDAEAASHNGRHRLSGKVIGGTIGGVVLVGTVGTLALAGKVGLLG